MRSWWPYLSALGYRGEGGGGQPPGMSISNFEWDGLAFLNTGLGADLIPRVDLCHPLPSQRRTTQGLDMGLGKKGFISEARTPGARVFWVSQIRQFFVQTNPRYALRRSWFRGRTSPFTF